MRYLGRAASVKRLLKGSLMLTGWERRGKDHWAAQSASRRVAVEVEGDPVRRVSIVIPTSPGAGTILGQFINEYMPESKDARAWAQRQLAEWGDRLKGDVAQHLEATTVGGARQLRLQSLGALAVVATISV